MQDNEYRYNISIANTKKIKIKPKNPIFWPFMAGKIEDTKRAGQNMTS